MDPDDRVEYDGPPTAAIMSASSEPFTHHQHRSSAGEGPLAGDLGALGDAMEMMQYDFMQRALVAAVLVGVAAPAVGIFLVQRRLALMGDGMGHIALTGVALGLLLGRAPVAVALLAAIAGAVTIELLRSRGRTTSDLALAIMFYGGIAGGVVLIAKAPGGSAATLNQYLFGAITTTTAEDLVVFGALAAAILAVTLGLARHLFAVSNDEEYARASGLPVAGEPAARRHDRHDGRGVHASRRPAADQRPDGGAGGDRPAHRRQLPRGDAALARHRSARAVSGVTASVLRHRQVARSSWWPSRCSR